MDRLENLYEVPKRGVIFVEYSFDVIAERAQHGAERGEPTRTPSDFSPPAEKVDQIALLDVDKKLVAVFSVIPAEKDFELRFVLVTSVRAFIVRDAITHELPQ